MKKLFLFVTALITGSASISQTVTYDFSTDPLTTGWSETHNSGSPATTGFNYSATNDNIDYNITTTTGNNFLERPTPYTLGDQFAVSFKIRLTSNTNNTFFPLLLTPSQIGGSNPHPWRLNPSPGIGALQNVDLLGVAILGRNVALVNRLGNSAAGITQYTTTLTLNTNTDYWIRLERICEDNVRLTVFSNENMTTVVRDQFFTTPALAAMNHLYIANCNGNATTHQTGTLDDYVISQPDNICCSPSQIEGDNVICSTDGPDVFSAAISGNNIQNPVWSISPSGPTFTQSTSGGYTMTVSDWNSAGTYTITFTWTCNCIEQSLTKVVTVQDPINAEDPVNISSNCTGTPNTHNFTVTATGTDPTIVRSWEIYLAANLTPGDYSTTGAPIATAGNVSSVNMSALPNSNAYVILCTHWYANGVCPPEIVSRKSICASGLILNPNPSDRPLLSPNPAFHVITVELPSPHRLNSVKIIDMDGRTISEQHVDSETKRLSFDIEKLERGIYTVIFNGSTAYAPEKFIKE